MQSSIDLSPKITNASKEYSSLISPNSRKLILRKGSKIAKKRIKNKKNDCKVDPEQSLPKKKLLKKNKSTKLSTLMISPKNITSKIQIGLAGSKPGKATSRILGNTSNRSLKLSVSPKSSYLSPEEIEFPIKPAKALSVFKSELTNYEQGEILRYNEIYYIGSITNKIPPKIECENYGFDDSHTDYLLVKRDHIAYRYEILKILGKGSFGIVC